ncbi:unnamed protein product, partial [Polarella glacialis]
VQVGLRRRLGVEMLPLQFVDATGMDIFTVIVPSDAQMTTIKGVLCFSEAPGVDYTHRPAPAPASPALAPAMSSSRVGSSAATAAAAAKEDESAEGQVQGKTVRQWEAEQELLFPGQPKLPPGWLRIKSRKGEVYFWNRQSQKASFELPEMPLPPGWKQHVSKTTGKSYYFHAAGRKSVFDRPTE